MTAANQDQLLADIRREIDATDDGILDLLERRLAASARVRQKKGLTESPSTTPYRPAREAQILRRIITRGAGVVEPAVLVRLWRVILSSSILAQAPVAVHATEAVGARSDFQLMIAEHFSGMAVTTHPDMSGVIDALEARRVDLAVVDATSDWAGFLAAAGGKAPSIAAALPLFTSNTPARLLVAGHVVPQPSGDDQSIILSRGPLPEDALPPAGWLLKSGDWVVSAVPGFLTSIDPVFIAAAARHPHLMLRVAGAIPAPLKALS